MNGQRVRNIFNPQSREPFRLSRSKIDNFVRCQRCFYLDRRLGVGQPQGPPFTLNSAVDALLKKEFDIHRAQQTTHPLMAHYGIEAVPFAHEDMNRWRENFVGLQYHHQPSNFLITGAVDDIWKDSKNNLIVVDYKATSTEKEISLEDEWKQAYKRQMEVYQWLLRCLGYQVANIGYFIFANGRKDRKAFDGKLEFDVQVLPYEGNDAWVEPILGQIRTCLEGLLPPYGQGCDFCAYRQAAQKYE